MAKTTTKAKTPAKRKPRPKKPAGRPTLYTKALIDEICERLSKGEPMAQICRDEKMPASRTIRDWMVNDKDISAAIAHAREDGHDAIALDALSIADCTMHDTIGGGEDGAERANTEWISRSKLRVDTRLKLLAKWDPKRYGDKIDVTSGGDKIGLADMIAEGRRRAEEGMGG